MSQSNSKSAKIAVAIASHISYDGQLNMLKDTITSLTNQSKKCSILISISFADKGYEKKFKSMKLHKVSNLKQIIISNEQKYQMEHYQILSSYFHGYDLILFCDDDDQYKKHRVREFENAYISASKSLKYNQKLAGIYSTESVCEYWSFGVVPSIIDSFFRKMKDDQELLKYVYADMMFREYLRRLADNKLMYPLRNKYPLYIHNKNSKSMTSLDKKHDGLNNDYQALKLRAIRSNAFLDAIMLGKCPSIRCAVPFITLKEIEDAFPEFEYIKVVCMFLYENHNVTCRCQPSDHNTSKQAALNQLYGIRNRPKMDPRDIKHLDQAIREIDNL